MPTLQANEARINYVQLDFQEGGPCEDLVMVHGLATNMAFWYFHYAVRLSKRFRVTLFDLRGHGRSEMTESGYTPDNLARDLAGLLDALSIRQAHFLTHSYGGVVALNFARLQPDRVASLVLCDTHIAAVRREARADGWGHGPEIQAIVDRVGLKLDTRDPYFGYKLLTEVSHLQMRSAEVPPELLDLVSPLLGKYGNRTAAQWVSLMDSTKAGAELMGDDGLPLPGLREFRFPILAMYGDQSQARLTGKELLEVWPHAEFRSVRRAGHFFPASRAEEVIHGCERLWGGEFATSAKLRIGETPRPHFGSDRVYEFDDSWYFLTREQAQVGPFERQEEASAVQHEFLSERVTTTLSELPDPVVAAPFKVPKEEPPERKSWLASHGWPISIAPMARHHAELWQSMVSPTIQRIEFERFAGIRTAEARSDAYWPLDWPMIYRLFRVASLLEKLPTLPVSDEGGAKGRTGALLYAITVQTQKHDVFPVGMLLGVANFAFPKPVDPRLEEGHQLTPRGSKRARTLFTWLVSAAPRDTLISIGVPSDIQLGRVLLDTTIQLSLSVGHRGSVLLHADPRGGDALTRFYENSLMQNLPEDGFPVISRLRRNDGLYYYFDSAHAGQFAMTLAPWRLSSLSRTHMPPFAPVRVSV